MALAFTATSTRQEIAQQCRTFQDLLDTLQRLRREHPTTKLDVDCLYSSFNSFCSTRRRTSRKHGCEEDCSYETQWPVYCEKNILALTFLPSRTALPSNADDERKQPRSPAPHPSRGSDVPRPLVADLVARLEHQQKELGALRAQREAELSSLRDQLQRAERLAEQAAADIAVFRQASQRRRSGQQLLAQRAAPSCTRKRKHSSAIDPVAALHDHVAYTSDQMREHLNIRFVAWRTDEEDASTVGVVCIEAVLTLLNDRLQRANDPHVRFLASYYGMEMQRSDDIVHERCMGVDFAAQRYVVAPASVDANHWAVIVWDNEERRILLLDSFGDLVKSTHAARLRRIMLGGSGRAQAQLRLSVVRQQDQVSCGLFVLFYCCFIVRNPTTWRETIGAVTFRLEDMREWLATLMVDGAHAAFTLDQLPAFVPAEANQSSDVVLVSDHRDCAQVN